MPRNESNYYRRRDSDMAERVQSGLSMLYRVGAAEACEYMARIGIADDVIKRVASARLVRGARVPVCILPLARLDFSVIA